MIIYHHNHCQYDDISGTRRRRTRFSASSKPTPWSSAGGEENIFNFILTKCQHQVHSILTMLTPCWHKYFQFCSDNVDTVFTSWKSALFPKICRANHSCVPNCNYVWNPELGQQQMFLVKKVSKDQILIHSLNMAKCCPRFGIWTIVIAGCVKRKHNYGA